LKLTIRKLGLIDHAELDIRPLTVLVGENGTNKTWTAYSIYGLMRSLTGKGFESPLVEYVFAEAERSPLDLIRADNAELASSLAQGDVRNLSLERDFSKYFLEASATRTLVGKAPFLRQLLRLNEVEPDVEIRLGLSSSEYGLTTEPVKISLDSSSRVPTLRSRVTSSYEFVVVVDSREKLREATWWEKSLASALNAWLNHVPGNAFVLPAERKTLDAAYYLLRDEFVDIVTTPVADYAEFLRLQKRIADVVFEVKGEFGFQDLALLLETQVVKGSFGFTGESEEMRLSFHPSNNEEVGLPIHAASSLVRALAGLNLYLETASPGDLIVIDELEMNAHPEAQLALIELVAMLVNRGLRVVMTTHSPYIVDHLNNLMAAARIPKDRQTELATHFQLKSGEAFLPADKVAAYHFALADGKVSVRDVLDRESESIDWRTFSRVTDALSNLYGRILDAKEGE
jgi:predicted ATPase